MTQVPGDCLSSLKLDRLLVGELQGEERQQAEVHLRHCSSCQARQALCERAQVQFVEQAPDFSDLLDRARATSSQAPRSQGPAGAGVRRKPSSAGRPWAGLVALGTAAAAALLLLATPEEPSPNADQGNRLKGSRPHLDWVVQRRGRVLDLRPGEPLHPGDSIRFRVQPGSYSYLAILGLDTANSLTTYHPTGAHLQTLATDRSTLLDAAFALDESLGAEQLYGVFCKQPELVEVVATAIRRQPEAPRLPRGCRLDRASWEKVPATAPTSRSHDALAAPR